MGLRSLVQVLLGIFGFALAVELLTSFGSGVAVIGGSGVGTSLLFLALLGDVAALVAVSLSGRAQGNYESRGGSAPPAIVYECSECGWKRGTWTTEQAQQLRQQHLREAHGRPAPTV